MSRRSADAGSSELILHVSGRNADLCRVKTYQGSPSPDQSPGTQSDERSQYSSIQFTLETYGHLFDGSDEPPPTASTPYSSGLPPTTRGHKAILTLSGVFRFVC